MRATLLCLACVLTISTSAVSDDDTAWERNYAEALQAVSDMPPLGDGAPHDAPGRVKRAEEASLDLVLPAAWRAWSGDGRGRRHLLGALDDETSLDTQPAVLLAAGLAAARLLGTPGPWTQLRARLVEAARVRLDRGRLDAARRLVATLSYAKQLANAETPTFHDLTSQVTRHLNLNRPRWEDREQMRAALTSFSR